MTRSPFATTSTVAASWWPSASGGSGQAELTGDQSQEAPAATEDNGSPATDQPVAAEAPVPAEPDTESPADFAAPAAAAFAAASAEPAADEHHDQFAGWPSFDDFSASVHDPASSKGAGAPAEPSSVPATGGDDLAAAVESLAGADAGVGSATSGESELGGPATALVDEPQPSTWDGGTGADVLDVAPVANAGTGSTQSLGDDSLARARSLLDELAALLPTLAAPAAAAVAADTSGVAATLTQARDAAAAEDSQFDELLAVVETARSRPRDIDVMLDLSRHVESIVTLKAGYDRSREAIETALSQVQTG